MKPSFVAENFPSQTLDLLHEIVRKFSKLQCSDPRDKIYGLLSLLNERSKAKVKPEYSEGVGASHSQTMNLDSRNCTRSTN
jgi:hypothetical protein